MPFLLPKSVYLDTHLLPAAPPSVDKNCPICNEDWNIAKEEVVRLLDCDHIFHRECLITWFDCDQQNCNTCPMCRRVLFDPTASIPVRPPRPTRVRPTREMLRIVHRETPHVLDTIDFNQVSNPEVPMRNLGLPQVQAPVNIALVDECFRVLLRGIVLRVLADRQSAIHIWWFLQEIATHTRDCWRVLWEPQQVLRGASFVNYLMTVMMRDYASNMTIDQWVSLSRYRRSDFLENMHTWSPMDISILCSVPEVSFRRVIPGWPAMVEINRTRFTLTDSYNRMVFRGPVPGEGGNMPLVQVSLTCHGSTNTSILLKRDSSENRLVIHIVERGFGTLLDVSSSDSELSLLNSENVRLRINFS
ncbi:hypothetical protein P154DRAFT_580773 [Amniculicola lignicola CBS 123094]|uniref:RING-type domain-containing protein n=1 Tax=Amniculicola lignicola CBS 123094 TaxID=1392246 RepID=A0A6A5WCV0_9PLEO|nr:hypothetical protein P154DRAFT_580773 [Amniculicola lignicola CBS 123094]